MFSTWNIIIQLEIEIKNKEQNEKVKSNKKNKIKRKNNKKMNFSNYEIWNIRVWKIL